MSSREPKPKPPEYKRNGGNIVLSPLASDSRDERESGFAFIRADKPPLLLTAMDVAPAVKAVSTPASKLNVRGGPVPISPIVIDPLPIIIWYQTTGELVIHAHGLPSNTKLTYAADGTDLGTASTDSFGNLKISAIQGVTGKIPFTVDLFSVQTVTVKDASGNVLISADF